MNAEMLAIESVEPMVHKISHRVANQFGLDAAEVYQEAQITAIRAVRSHDPQKRTLVSWVTLLITQHLYKRVKSRKWRERFSRMQTVSSFDQWQAPEFNLEQLVVEVSQDAATAIELAVTEGVPDKAYIETLLSASYNWTSERISRTFSEVRDALQ